MNTSRSIVERFSYNEGILYRKYSTSSRAVANTPAGWKSDSGYLITSVLGKKYRVHRIIWEMFNGSIPDKMEIDHVNGNRSDNRIENLRLVSSQDNSRNMAIRSNNTSGFVGVSYDKKAHKWFASIRVDGKTIALGVFREKEEAIKARKKGELEFNFHPNHGRK